MEEVWTAIKVFLIPILIVILLLYFNEKKIEKKNKTQGKRNKKSSDEFEENLNNYFGIEDKKKYEEEWNYDQQELVSFQIKIKKQQIESHKVFDVMAFGMLGFTKDQIDQTKLEKNEAKFTCYVFDVTDKDNEIPLQGLTEPYKDDSFLLSSNRNMKVGIGFAYNEWTPMFRFPIHLVVPPNRGKRKIKFIVSATKINAKFENGLIKKKKRFIF
tara:strand:- start:570 stop:1211 length:642 start_codon:yes stop_codon:yes gene_type:complete